MALRTVQQLKESVAGLLTGLNLNNITNLDTALSRAARYVAQKIDAPEATGREPITLYSGVYYYTAPETLFGTAVNLIRPSGNSGNPYQSSIKVPIDVFTRGKHYFPNGYMLDLEYDKGVGIIGISSDVPLPRLNLSSMSSASDFTGGGSVGTIYTDTVNYWENPAAIRFTLTGASTGTITTNLTSAIDLSDYAGVGVIFLAIETPSATDLTSIDLRVGSDSANYYTNNETSGFLGAWQANEWLLVAFDLASATTVGSPVITAIDYLQVRINHAATLSNFRLGGCWVAMPSLNEIIYQTAAIFKDSNTGALSQEITSDNNLIILNDAAFSILELESAKTIAMQQAGGQYTDQVKGFDDVLLDNNSQQGLYSRYTANNPSAQLRTTSSYYDTNDRYDRGYLS
jgi:hypothetical protein